MSTTRRRSHRFTVLCNDPERQQLSRLADQLRRSQGDTIRLAVDRLAVESGIKLTNTEDRG